MKTKHFIIIGIILVALVAGYFMFFKKSTGSAVPASNVNPEWESYVQKSMQWMKNDPNTVKLLKEKAAKEKRSYTQQLRIDAEWYADQEGISRTL